MTHKPRKKPPLYSEINELLHEYGESAIVAAQNPLFRQRVTPEVLELFSPTSVSAFTLETTRAILESFEKGAIDLKDIFLLKEFVLEWQQQAIDQEGDLSLHETISIILQSGNLGESIAEASKKLLKQGKVDEYAVSSY